MRFEWYRQIPLLWQENVLSLEFFLNSSSFHFKLSFSCQGWILDLFKKNILYYRWVVSLQLAVNLSCFSLSSKLQTFIMMALNIVLSAFPSVSDPFSLVTSYVTFKCNSLVQNVIVVYNPQKQSLVIVVLQTRSYQIFLNFGLIHLNIELNVVSCLF